MPQDYIVEEVRRVREEQAAKYAFDIKAIIAAARRRQWRSRREVVSMATPGLKPNNRLHFSVRKPA